MFIFLIACAGSKDIDGIWAILIPGAVEADCSESISHNFTDAFVPDDDEDSDQPFVSEQETESSEAMQLIQITRHSKREATLIKGTRAYPGSLGDNGAWKFEWGGNDITTTTQTHQDGYDYTADEDVTTTTTIRLTKNKETVGGTWTGVTHTIAGYTETDAWSSEITEVGDRGQIPSALYLITDVTGAERPAENERDFAECSGSDCELDLDITCTSEREYSGWRTGYDDEDAYGHLGAVGQPAGG
ncbi:MAG TPA: hypothetical protein QGF58_08465 [Myxococcota bacterium]|nr:hypothetical protein [Myxococcota bacterium]